MLYAEGIILFNARDDYYPRGRNELQATRYPEPRARWNRPAYRGVSVIYSGVDPRSGICRRPAFALYRRFLWLLPQVPACRRPLLQACPAGLDRIQAIQSRGAGSVHEGRGLARRPALACHVSLPAILAHPKLDSLHGFLDSYSFDGDQHTFGRLPRMPKYFLLFLPEQIFVRNPECPIALVLRTRISAHPSCA
jgi:hypothetical protein